jgi:hypothetical protein
MKVFLKMSKTGYQHQSKNYPANSQAGKVVLKTPVMGPLLSTGTEI